MFLPSLLIFTVIQVATRSQTITSVYVQSNAPVTLTCPADDQATTLTWTGPGGTLYVTGTTVETGLDGKVKPRISARHTGGSYTLTFTEFRSSDTGIYTCTVDETVDTQMVIVQGVTSASPVYTRQGGTVTLQCPDTGGSDSTSWSVTSIVLVYYDGTDINPNIPDDTRTRLSVTRQDGKYNLQISDVQLSDVREYRCSISTTNTLYHLLLYNKRKSLQGSSKEDDHHNVGVTSSSLPVYEDINDHRRQAPNQESSNYEALGKQSLPNVYEDLQRGNDARNSNYENTAV